MGNILYWYEYLFSVHAIGDVLQTHVYRFTSSFFYFNVKLEQTTVYKIKAPTILCITEHNTWLHKTCFARWLIKRNCVEKVEVWKSLKILWTYHSSVTSSFLNYVVSNPVFYLHMHIPTNYKIINESRRTNWLYYHKIIRNGHKFFVWSQVKFFCIGYLYGCG